MQKIVDGELVDLTTGEEDGLAADLAAWEAGHVGRLLAHNAMRRWRLETGGIEVGGMTVATDRESQMLIMGGTRLAELQPLEPIKFKAASGWADIDAAAMQGIATAVGEHVRNAFKIEGNIAESILAETITTIAGVDAAWAAEEDGE